MLKSHRPEFATLISKKVDFRLVGQILTKIYYFGVYYFRTRLWHDSSQECLCVDLNFVIFRRVFLSDCRASRWSRSTSSKVDKLVEYEVHDYDNGPFNLSIGYLS